MYRANIHLDQKVPELEKLIHSSYEGLLVVDVDGVAYDDPSHMAELLSPRGVDESTLSAIEIKS